MSYAETLIPPQPAPPEAAKAMTPARLLGYGLVTLWALLAVLLVAMVVGGWDTDNFTRYGPRYLHGLMTTLTLVNDLCGRGNTVEARIYKDKDHSGVVNAAAADAIGFARAAVGGIPVAATCRAL